MGNVFLLLDRVELKPFTDEEKLEMGIKTEERLNLTLLSIDRDKNRFCTLPIGRKIETGVDLILRAVGIYEK
ncbi:MAG: hypothetical protein WAV41_03460 [Microgenomates group bacterium]